MRISKGGVEALVICGLPLDRISNALYELFFELGGESSNRHYDRISKEADRVTGDLVADRLYHLKIAGCSSASANSLE